MYLVRERRVVLKVLGENLNVENRKIILDDFDKATFSRLILNC